MSDDVLQTLPPEQVAGFYRRLAAQVDRNKGALQVSLAALLLNHWLDNRDRNSTFHFEAPRHLRQHAQTLAVLRYHRAVFLTEKKARLGGGVTKWVGALPRLQALKPYKRWDGISVLHMDYQSLVEMPLRYQLLGSDADRDLLYALHGFQLKSSVALRPRRLPTSKSIHVEFIRFDVRVIDRYDWDYREHLTVPNPDHKSGADGAVAPDRDKVRVYHRNAKRIEDAGLAAPYNLETKPWQPAAADITQPAELDPDRKL